MAFIELLEKVFHVFVRNGEVVHLFLWLLFVDLVLVWILVAALEPSFDSRVFVVFSQLIVIEGVRTLIFAQMSLGLHVVAVDEEANYCVDECID